MALTGVKVDGVEYPHIHIVGIKRSAEILDGENAGRSTSADMTRDILGTFYNYTVELDSDDADPAEYDSLYEVLSAPENSHLVVMPYGQTTRTYTAYVSKVEDELEAINGDTQKWGSMTFQFIAMSPQRRP